MNDTVFQTTNVTISNVNVEQDFVLTNSWQGGTRESRDRRGPAAPVVAAPAPQPASSTPTPQVWIVPLPNYTPTTSQQTVLSLLASSWSSWNAGF